MQLRGQALVDALRAMPYVDRDAWFDAAIGFESLPPDAPLPRGAVPYLPCGVDEIVAMALDVPLTAGDVLVDLGSGLGRVLILAHLVTGVQGRGIEIQPALVAAARAHCDALGIDAITFVVGDAAELELDGSVFFLYAPFNGEMLARVMTRLHATARRHPITVCTVGIELADPPWLERRASTSAALAIYSSKLT